MARVTMRVEGLKELELALRELPKATGRSTLRNALKDGGKPIENDARARARFRKGALKRSYKTGTKLSKRQAAIHRRWAGTTAVRTSEGWRSAPAKSVFVFVGPGPLPQAITEEFGTSRQAAHPSLTPAWDGQKMTALAIIVQRLRERIEAARQRLARKAEREAARIQRGA